jgi:WG containing repeat
MATIRLAIICLFSLPCTPVLAQDLQVKDVTYYLDPLHFHDTTRLSTKGFRFDGMRVASHQETMYVYKGDDGQSIYFGGIDPNVEYRRFHVSYYFECPSGKDTSFVVQLKNLEHKWASWKDAELYEDGRYEFYIYGGNPPLSKTTCLLKVYAKEQQPLNIGRAKLPGKYDHAKNVFISHYKSYSHSKPFDTNDRAVVSGKEFAGLINRTGEFILLPEYVDITPLSAKIYRVAKYAAGGAIKFGLVDSSGKEVVPVKYDKIELSKSGKVLVTNDGVESELK